MTSICTYKRHEVIVEDCLPDHARASRRFDVVVGCDALDRIGRTAKSLCHFRPWLGWAIRHSCCPVCRGSRATLATSTDCYWAVTSHGHAHCDCDACAKRWCQSKHLVASRHRVVVTDPCRWAGTNQSKRSNSRAACRALTWRRRCGAEGLGRCCHRSWVAGFGRVRSGRRESRRVVDPVRIPPMYSRSSR